MNEQFMSFRIRDRIEQLRGNFENSFHEFIEDELFQVDDRVYKFLNIQDNWLRLNKQQIKNQMEIECLQFLAGSFYTCQIQRNLCDLQYYSWIATTYMNLGNLNMDCYEMETDHNNLLSASSIYLISFQLLRILNYFHQRGIYHMDVKPKNILLHYEYQFCYQAQNILNAIEQPYQQELEQLRIDLLENNNDQGQFDQNQIEPDYVSFQQILQRNFQNAREDLPIQLLLYRQQFNNEQTNQLIYWIRKWLEKEGIQTFNRNNIFIKKWVKICLCDFGLTQQFYNQNQELQIQQIDEEENFYKTPYKILRDHLHQNYFTNINIQDIKRQQDLFCLGQTIFYLLQINIKIELYVDNLNQERVRQICGFICQQLNINQLNDNISLDELNTLNRYYSQIRSIGQLKMNLQNSNQQNTKIYQVLSLISEMIKFSFTPSNFQNFIQFENYFYDISDIRDINRKMSNMQQYKISFD
ncbi:unnamed protein product [Paramecium sonneborni]|uniref:Protein kinase domain-containing protein n=1 Tax=Paramecium sonneborni TaxID=65129 RepID=A0A8S1RCI0_9CILI|nr:unnamed protein product [Paramecium sonneborni]